MNSSLNSLIKQLNENFNIREEEFEEEELDEMNTTSNLDGGSGQPQTPYAFSKTVKDPDDVSYSEKVQSTERFYKKIEEVFERSNVKVQSLIEADYKSFKNDETRTERQKINQNVIEINKKLREVEQMISHATKLKTETGSGSDIYWKGTLGSFLKIKERLNRLSNKIVEMNS